LEKEKDYFTKTGSGQASGKLQKQTLFEQEEPEQQQQQQQPPAAKASQAAAAAAAAAIEWRVFGVPAVWGPLLMHLAENTSMYAIMQVSEKKRRFFSTLYTYM
jgi:hypothetical protein